MTALHLELTHAPTSAARARTAVREHLQAAGLEARPGLLDDAELVASELVTNAIRYGAPPVVLTLLLVPASVAAGGPRVVIACSDGGTWVERPAGDGGRGLLLVRALSTDVTVDTTDGTTVTARLAP